MGIAVNAAISHARNYRNLPMLSRRETMGYAWTSVKYGRFPPL